MSYQVALLNFEGPLDLLLQLIERSELKITEISLASMTEQYLTYIGQIKDIDAPELNQFIELAAKLIHIKSQALLPEMVVDEELEQDLNELAAQLERYRHYQKASTYLGELLRADRHSWPREIKQSLPPEKLPAPTIDLDTLNQVFQTALARLPLLEEENLEASITLEEMMELVLAYSQQAAPATLGHLLRRVRSRMEALVLFLAVLELIKLGQISARQHSQFDDIVLSNE